MLTKVHRLNKQKDFDNVFRQGGTTQDDFLAIRFLPNQQVFSRFGLVVSAKVAPKAVERNRLRRRLSELVRLQLKRIKPGLDFVVVVKAKMPKAAASQMQASLFGLLKKKNLYV